MKTAQQKHQAMNNTNNQQNDVRIMSRQLSRGPTAGAQRPTAGAQRQVCELRRSKIRPGFVCGMVSLMRNTRELATDCGLLFQR